MSFCHAAYPLSSWSGWEPSNIQKVHQNSLGHGWFQSHRVPPAIPKSKLWCPGKPQNSCSQWRSIPPKMVWKRIRCVHPFPHWGFPNSEGCNPHASRLNDPPTFLESKKNIDGCLLREWWCELPMNSGSYLTGTWPKIALFSAWVWWFYLFHLGPLDDPHSKGHSDTANTFMFLESAWFVMS